MRKRQKSGYGRDGILWRKGRQWTVLVLCVIMLCTVVSCAGEARTREGDGSDTHVYGDVESFRGQTVCVLSGATALKPVSDGSPIEKALYLCDLAVSETLGVRVEVEMRSAVTEADWDALLKEMTLDAASGEAQYDLFRVPAETATVAAAKGILGDLRELPNGTADQEDSAARIHGRLPFCYGAFDPEFADLTCVMAVSEPLLQSGGISAESLLQTAYDGGFTVEEMIRIGDAVMAARSAYPLTCTDAQATSMYFGAGFGAIDASGSKSEVDGGFLEGDPMRFFTVLSGWMRNHRSPVNTYGAGLFREQKLLMMPTLLSSLPMLSEQAGDILILPLPKWDDAVAQYSTPITRSAPVYAYSASAENSGLCGAVLRILMEKGTQAVLPALYECIYGVGAEETSLRMTVFREALSCACFDLGYTASGLFEHRIDRFLWESVHAESDIGAYRVRAMMLSEALLPFLVNFDAMSDADIEKSFGIAS